MVHRVDMAEQSDDDLFLYMSFYDDPADRPLAEAAFGELHARYVKELHSRCRQLCHRLGQPDSVAEDLTSLTLRRALSRAETFRGPASRGRTMAWLSAIARNLLIDSKRNPHRPNAFDNVTEISLAGESHSAMDFAALYNELKSPLPTAEHLAVVATAFETLEEREQRILIETLLQRAKSPGHTHMYRGSCTLLAKELGITQENLRRIRFQALKKISQRVVEHFSTRGTRNAAV